MNTNEYLLTKLIEECAEVIHRTTKAQRFAMQEVEPGQEMTNEERLRAEILQVFAVIEMIEDHNNVQLGMHAYRGSWPTTRTLIDEHKQKVRKFMQYSRTECGTLTED